MCVTGSQLCAAHSQLTQYKDKYGARLKVGNTVTTLIDYYFQVFFDHDQTAGSPVLASLCAMENNYFLFPLDSGFVLWASRLYRHLATWAVAMFLTFSFDVSW